MSDVYLIYFYFTDSFFFKYQGFVSQRPRIGHREPERDASFGRKFRDKG